MKLILTVNILIACVTNLAMADYQYVHPYFRQNGHYVQGYWRTTPDDNPYNNFSTRGNVNPFTGKTGTVNPENYYMHTQNVNYYPDEQ